MGKIDSREIGEVDSHGDSASSLLLIKYATESQSICFQPQREEAAQEWKGRNISHHLSVHRLSFGLMEYSFLVSIRPNRYAADMENMPSQLDESAQSTQTSCDSTLHALLFLNPAAFFCLRFWMLHIHFPVGLQLKARARTWRMCRQTEGEPREEKPKWIHSLSWMEEERRGEGDVRASFSCLCPVESAQTPGAAPASGSARTFTPSCQSKLSLAATLLWHRHIRAPWLLAFSLCPPCWK
ncbi:uncharacterized protein ACIB01_011608 isoform 5-T5 [Guaruba guarouba]